MFLVGVTEGRLAKNGVVGTEALEDRGFLTGEFICRVIAEVRVDSFDTAKSPASDITRCVLGDGTDVSDPNGTTDEYAAFEPVDSTRTTAFCSVARPGVPIVVCAG